MHSQGKLKDVVEQIIRENMGDAQVTVQDTRGDGYHIVLNVVSSLFCHKTRLDRYRMIHNILGARVGNEIHALQMRLVTPDEDNS